MEKRLFVAVLVSIAFLWAWQALAPRLFPELVRVEKARTPAAAPKVSEKTPEPPPAVVKAKSVAVPVVKSDPALAAVTLEVASDLVNVSVVEPVFTAILSNRGAQLVSFRLTQFPEKKGEAVELVKSRPLASGDFPFAIVSSDAAWNSVANHSLYVVRESDEKSVRTVEFRLGTPQGSVVKTFRFINDYEFDFSVVVTGNPAPYRISLGPGIRTLRPEEKDNQFTVTGNGLIDSGGKLEVIPREKAHRFQIFEGMPALVGIQDNYFLSVLRPTKAGSATFRVVNLPSNGTKPGEKPTTRPDLVAGLNAVEGEVSGKAFFGPKDAAVLESHGLEQTLNFGFFGIISRFLLTALIWINTFTRNFGWAIVVLTIIIKILLYPLQHKSIVSMKKMQKVQPKMNAIRDRYKKAKTDVEQRQKMNMEMMKLYQVEGISPMSGCLPILLQIPILWAFYGLLSHAIQLRGADFALWINDLSAKDPYYITPILMTATMFIQQLITPTTVDPAQRRIFLMMPIIFGWFFKEFPSGLVLYWLVQNILSIAQQLIMNKYWKDHPEEVKAA